MFYSENQKVMTGDEIKKLRIELKLTQEDLAEMLGVARLTIVNYEKGGKIPEARLVMLNDILKGISRDEKPALILDDIIYNRVYNKLKPELQELKQTQVTVQKDFMRLFNVVLELRDKIDKLQDQEANNRKRST